MSQVVTRCKIPPVSIGGRVDPDFRHVNVLALSFIDIFRAHKSKTGGSDGKIVEPDAPKYPDQRLAALVWEDQDDEVLLRAAKDYGHNWRLVADVVNSARVYVSTEKRTPWDCFDRWAVKVGYPSKRSQAVAAANAAAAAAANAASTSQIPGEQGPASAATMGTPSLKPALPSGQPMNPSITGLKAEDVQVDSPVSPGGSIRKDQSHVKAGKTTKYEGSKKKVRMTVLRDSIRRIQKRREANKAKQNGELCIVVAFQINN
jgi:chromatin modification-related protein VID21